MPTYTLRTQLAGVSASTGVATQDVYIVNGANGAPEKIVSASATARADAKTALQTAFSGASITSWVPFVVYEDGGSAVYQGPLSGM
jgi:hypothetical protein